MSAFATTAAHDAVRYSQVWEDHALLEQGLAVGPGDDVLSIGSAGCNVLAMLLAEPRSILAVDVSPAQAALIELKLAALHALDHHEFVVLLGARDGDDRLALYARVRDALPAEARAFWDANGDELAAGVLGRGLLDRYIVEFQRRFVSELVDPAAIAELLASADPVRQGELFDRHLATPEFQAAVQDWFARDAISGTARDATQFRYVEADEDVAGAFWARFRHVCTTVPARGNFYLEWLLTGRYADLDTGPPFLRPANFERLRALSDRVTVVRARLDEVLRDRPDGSFSKANLSDVFEYMSAEETEELQELLVARMRAGGRIAYWNLFVPRAASAHLEPLIDDAYDLLLADRVPFYGAFHLDLVTA